MTSAQQEASFSSTIPISVNDTIVCPSPRSEILASSLTLPFPSSTSSKDRAEAREGEGAREARALASRPDAPDRGPAGSLAGVRGPPGSPSPRPGARRAAAAGASVPAPVDSAPDPGRGPVGAAREVRARPTQKLARGRAGRSPGRGLPHRSGGGGAQASRGVRRAPLLSGSETRVSRIRAGSLRGRGETANRGFPAGRGAGSPTRGGRFLPCGSPRPPAPACAPRLLPRELRVPRGRPGGVPGSWALSTAPGPLGLAPDLTACRATLIQSWPGDTELPEEKGRSLSEGWKPVFLMRLEILRNT
ncbi:uncharacterized protein LOC106694615 [Myotis lucifugus]|uniref:uncharacterized protein LOC106694615 n=1 Tax=Myotis lucifugus TaxID=59463 RepID=UPI000CCC41E2|nr:uncharacterized protein LOC106694615 [Myotis lucifugus]